MLVNSRSAKACCKNCDSDFGHGPDSKGKKALKRSVRRRENRAWKQEVR